MSRSRKGHSSSPVSGSKSPNLASEIAELKEATRLAHEAIQMLKEERKGLQRDLQHIEFAKRLVDAAAEEAKSMIHGEVATVMAGAIEGSIDAANLALNHSIEEMANAIREFRKAKDSVLEKATNELKEELDVVRNLVKSRGNGRIEYVEGVDEDPTPTVPSTFGNGG